MSAMKNVAIAVDEIEQILNDMPVAQQEYTLKYLLSKISLGDTPTGVYRDLSDLAQEMMTSGEGCD